MCRCAPDELRVPDTLRISRGPPSLLSVDSPAYRRLASTRLPMPATTKADSEVCPAAASSKARRRSTPGESRIGSSCMLSEVFVAHVRVPLNVEAEPRTSARASGLILAVRPSRARQLLNMFIERMNLRGHLFGRHHAWGSSIGPIATKRVCNFTKLFSRDFRKDLLFR